MILKICACYTCLCSSLTFSFNVRCNTGDESTAAVLADRPSTATLLVIKLPQSPTYFLGDNHIKARIGQRAMTDPEDPAGQADGPGRVIDVSSFWSEDQTSNVPPTKATPVAPVCDIFHARKRARLDSTSPFFVSRFLCGSNKWVLQHFCGCSRNSD